MPKRFINILLRYFYLTKYDGKKVLNSSNKLKKKNLKNGIKRQ